MPSYVLKVTKFLGNVSQFEFLVMTEKNIFAYKLVCHQIFQILIYFLCENYTPPWKMSPPLSQQPPIKVEVLSSPTSLFKNLVGDSNPPAERGGGGAHYVGREHKMENGDENT